MDTISRSIIKAVIQISKENDINEVVFAGGVSASKYISNKVINGLKKQNIIAYFTKGEYSTDNAIGCALIGLKNFKTGE